jgi:putative PIN family toxin of toxin-antitoxin system
LLRQWDSGRFVLCISEPILHEIRDVLARPEVRRKNPAITDERVEALVQRLAATATFVADVPRRVSLARDPKDEPYLDLALSRGVPYLVSRDRDLLDLMAEQSFRSDHPGLTILDPVAFLRLLSSPPAASAPSQVVERTE